VIRAFTTNSWKLSFDTLLKRRTVRILHSKQVIDDDHKELKCHGLAWNEPAAHYEKVARVPVYAQKYLLV
jgi:hypothetical protein